MDVNDLRARRYRLLLLDPYGDEFLPLLADLFCTVELHDPITAEIMNFLNLYNPFRKEYGTCDIDDGDSPVSEVISRVEDINYLASHFLDYSFMLLPEAEFRAVKIRFPFPATHQDEVAIAKEFSGLGGYHREALDLARAIRTLPENREFIFREWTTYDFLRGLRGSYVQIPSSFLVEFLRRRRNRDPVFEIEALLVKARCVDWTLDDAEEFISCLSLRATRKGLRRCYSHSNLFTVLFPKEISHWREARARFYVSFPGEHFDAGRGSLLMLEPKQKGLLALVINLLLQSYRR